MKNSSIPDFPVVLPFSIAQYFPVSTAVQCSMGTNFPKPQVGILMTVQLGHPPSMYIYVRGVQGLEVCRWAVVISDVGEVYSLSKARKLRCCRGLLNNLKSALASPVAIFSSKKTFTVYIIFNPQSSCCISFKGTQAGDNNIMMLMKHQVSATALSFAA